MKVKSEMIRGKIFDIRRFSTHDGCGIRTTVFLKGCPLKCVWCQNPEGISTKTYPMHLPSKCINCKTCLFVSRANAVYLKDGTICLRKEVQDDWENIIKECPSGAIVMDSQIYEVDELVRELLKDEVFFKRGGGVTLSGGEPLMQGDFAVELLKRLHKMGIHTAIETSLSVPTSTVERALPYLDLIYADMKIADNEKHKKYVGMSNELIKRNLECILTSKKRENVIIRTPLIPEYTATEENLSEVAKFLSGVYPDVKYELLNYNPLAKAKYHLVDKEYCFVENPEKYTKEQMTGFGEIVKRNGIKNLIMEI